MKIDFDICKFCLKQRMYDGFSYEKPSIVKYVVAYRNGKFRFLAHVTCSGNGCGNASRECLVSIKNPEELFHSIFPNVDASKSGRLDVPEQYNEIINNLYEISTECLQYEQYYLIGLANSEDMEEIKKE